MQHRPLVHSPSTHPQAYLGRIYLPFFPFFFLTSLPSAGSFTTPITEPPHVHAQVGGTAAPVVGEQGVPVPVAETGTPNMEVAGLGDGTATPPKQGVPVVAEGAAPPNMKVAGPGEGMATLSSLGVTGRDGGVTTSLGLVTTTNEGVMGLGEKTNPGVSGTVGGVETPAKQGVTVVVEGMGNPLDMGVAGLVEGIPIPPKQGVPVLVEGAASPPIGGGSGLAGGTSTPS